MASLLPCCNWKHATVCKNYLCLKINKKFIPIVNKDLVCKNAEKLNSLSKHVSTGMYMYITVLYDIL